VGKHRLLIGGCQVILAILPIASDAAVSYVQGTAVVSARSGTEASASFPSTQAAGDLDLVFIAWRNAAAQVVSVSDTSGNLYLRAGSIANAGVATQVVYYANNVARAAPGRNKVTVVFSNPVEQTALGIAEYHGVDPLEPIDVTAGVAGTAGTADSGSLAISNAHDLLVASAFTAGRLLGPPPFYRQRLLPDGGSFVLADNAFSAPGTYSATARQSLDSWYVMQLVALRGSRKASDIRAPYPKSQVITGVQWDFSTLLSHRKAIGSDIWPMTWAADGKLYAAWGDGGGFDGTEERRATGRTSLGFARIEGTPDPADPSSFTGRNVWGQAPAFAEAQASFGGKVADLISVDGVLYAQGALWRQENCGCADATVRSEQNPAGRTLAWSADLGKTWRLAPWVSGAELGTSLQFGRDYSGAFDAAHVYLYYQRDVKRHSTHIYLRRVRSADITAEPATPGHFEYWSGIENNAPLWSTTEADAQAVFSDPNVEPGTFAAASIVYDAPLGRYLLAAWHGPATGQIGFFEAQAPWGPWATVAYYEDWEGLTESAGEATGLSVPTKWISSDGRALWVVFSGVNNGADNDFDSFNLVRGTLLK
jgi:hypothetical protein